MSINNRLFGAPIKEEVVKKLEARQQVAGQVAPGESLDGTKMINGVFTDSNGNIQADLSSRTPFVRMWTSIKLIDPAEIKAASEKNTTLFEQISKEEYEQLTRAMYNPDEGETGHDAVLAKTAAANRYNKLLTTYKDISLHEVYPLGYQNNYEDVAHYITNDQSIEFREQVDYARQTYVIGDYNYQSGYGEVGPNESNEPYIYKSPDYRTGGYQVQTDAQEQYEENIDEVEGIADTIFKPELTTNPLLKPQSGITKVSTETEGTLGVIKSTTIDFVVNNFYDYDRIFNKYFLKPGATVFVDFGWSSVENLYNPEELINDYKGIEHFLYNDPLEDDDKDYTGVVTANQGDLEVLQGIVTNYTSKIEMNGSVSCQLTLKSANSTLLSFETDDRIVNKIKSILERGLLFLGVQAVLREQAEEAEKNNDNEYKNSINDLEQLLNTPDSSTEAKDVENYNKNLNALANKFLSSKNGKPSSNSVRTGVFVEDFDFDNTYISLGLFEDLIINSQFGFGKSPEDINEGKRGQVRMDSSNSFTSFNQKMADSQQVILNVPEPAPAFLYPEWWMDRDPKGIEDGGGSYTYQKEKWAKEDSEYKAAKEANRKLFGADFLNSRIPIRELFISTGIITTAFTQNDNVKKAINQILKEINKYSSSLLNLVLIAGDTESQIKIADKNYTEFDEQDKLVETEIGLDKTFTFNVMSPNSIVKDYNLEFKLPTGNIGNMYAIQGMSHGDSIFAVNESIIDLKNLNKLDNDSLSIIYEPDLGTHRLKQYTDFNSDSETFNVYNQINQMFSTDTYNVNVIPPEGNTIEGATEEAMYSSEDVIDDTINEDEDSKSPDLDALIKINEENLRAVGIKVAQTFTDYFGYSVTDEVVRTIPRLLPYTLSLTTYGIASIQPGETFKVDYLPKTYLNKTYLQIMKVRHDIGPDGWYTSFDTQFRLKESITSNQEKRTNIRLSVNALTTLGFENQLTVDDTWDFLKGDSYIAIKEFAAYMTDVTVYQPKDYNSSTAATGDNIDYIIDFITTNQISQVIIENQSMIQNIVTGQVVFSGNAQYPPRGSGFRHVYDRAELAQPDIEKYNLPGNDMTSHKKQTNNPLFERVYGGVNSLGKTVTPNSRENLGYYELNVAPKNVIMKPNKQYQFYVRGNYVAIIDRDMFNGSLQQEINYINYWNTHAGMKTVAV